MKRKFGTIAMTLVIAACSGGGDSKKNPEPTDQINSKISGKATSALIGQSALFETSRGYSKKSESKFISNTFNRGLSRSAFNNALSARMFAFASPPIEKDNKALLQDKAKRAGQYINPNTCNIDLLPTENSGASDSSGVGSEFSPSKIKISGSNCPVDLKMDITMTAANGSNICTDVQNTKVCKFTGKIKMDYQVVDEKLMAELQVKQGYVDMTFDLDMTMPSGEQTGQVKFTTKGKAVFDMKATDLEGQVHQISGNQDGDLSMVISNNSREQEPQIFADMKEELKYFNSTTQVTSTLSAAAKVNGKNKSESYFVDGVKVTAKAYINERQKFANSMMEMSSDEDSKSADGRPVDNEPQPQPSPEPTPNPSPRPQPQPQPQPQPLPPSPPNPPRPIPNPTPAPSEWVCVVEDYSSYKVFIGYGSNKFIATSKAKQACSELSRSCSSYPECEQQDQQGAWFCETKNSETGRIFNGAGHSKTEAGYLARRDCINFSTNANSCPRIYSSDCVRQ